jgi:hypothetical protein
VVSAVACVSSPEPPADKKQLHAAYERHHGANDHAAAAGDARVLSRVYWIESNFRDALRWSQVALTEAISSGDSSLRGRSLNWFGNVFQIVGDHARAMELYAEADRHLQASDKLERARMNVYQAWYLDSTGSSALAEGLLEGALLVAREAEDRRLIRAVASNLGDIATRSAASVGDVARRKRALEKAGAYLDEARATLDGEQPSAGLLLHEARLATARGDLADAERILAEAATRAPLETRWQIDCERGRVAEVRRNLDEAARSYAAAIEIVEELRRDSAPIDVQAPFLQMRWEPYQRLLALQLAREDATGAFSTIARAQGRMFVDSLAIRVAEEGSAPRDHVNAGIARIDGLERVVPLLARSPVVRSISAERVLTALRASKVRHVLMYFADRDRMRLVAVVDGAPRLTRVNVSLTTLAQLVDGFRARPDDPGVAAELGAAILPQEALPADRGERIHVVPAGTLMTVGFAALRVAGERLLDRHEIVLAPSVVWLAALSDEVFVDNGDRIVIADSRSNLPKAEQELRRVVAHTGATAYMGKDANRDALCSAAGSALLHVISHSGMDDRGGYLALSSGKVGTAEILEGGINPRLVVLPTCGSAATGRIEMWDSLASAFLAAGSSHVVATLASVEDSAAATFTELFYLHGGVGDPVGATTRAQRELARTHGAKTWSAFVVAGL